MTHDIMGHWFMPLTRETHLEDTTKLALADVPDVDDVVSWILQELQPEQDADGDDYHDTDHNGLLRMVILMILVLIMLILILVLKLLLV